MERWKFHFLNNYKMVSVLMCFIENFTWCCLIFFSPSKAGPFKSVKPGTYEVKFAHPRRYCVIESQSEALNFPFRILCFLKSNLKRIFWIRISFLWEFLGEDLWILEEMIVLADRSDRNLRKCEKRTKW